MQRFEIRDLISGYFSFRGSACGRIRARRKKGWTTPWESFVWGAQPIQAMVCKFFDALEPRSVILGCYLHWSTLCIPSGGTSLMIGASTYWNPEIEIRINIPRIVPSFYPILFLTWLHRRVAVPRVLPQKLMRIHTDTADPITQAYGLFCCIPYLFIPYFSSSTSSCEWHGLSSCQAIFIKEMTAPIPYFLWKSPRLSEGGCGYLFGLNGK